MDNRTFANSQQALDYLQGKYGSADYRAWQSLRREFWSYVAYPAAGAPTFQFFGDSIGANGITKQFTNIPKASSFGQQHFLVKQIRTDFWLADYEIMKQFTAADTSVLYSDIVNGIFQAGVLELLIGDRVFCQILKPFLMAPPSDGRAQVHTAGLRALTLVEAAPNTFGTLISSDPYASLGQRYKSGYVVDPNILVEAEQNFQVRIRYDSGSLGVIATDVVNDDSNPLRVGVILDGILFRPVQ